MLWVFSVAGLTGIFCGSLLRAPALVMFCLFSFGGVFVVSGLGGSSLINAIVTAFMTCAALQVGYLLGLGIQQGWRPIQRFIKGLYRGFEMENPMKPSAKPGFDRFGQKAKLRNFAGHRSL